jgi:hypothetical protein
MISAKGLSSSSAWSNLYAKLNGTWHEKALWVYLFIVVMHWIEHLVQAYQIFIAGMPRPESLGWLGMMYPWLVKSEALHFGYAVFMLAGLILLQPGYFGRSRLWWNISLGIQTWHFIEHALLQGQAIFKANLFGSAVPTSVLQLWFPRPELHLFYNAAVFIPMIIAMYYHRYPPAGELDHHTPQCTCAIKAR